MAVFCPCREPHELNHTSIPSLIHEKECYFSAASLLFCTECRAIRCPYCTIKEPVSWFCSQCLMETTKREAAESSNRCLRNCVRCPRCKANAIIKTEGDTGMYTIRCSLCDYRYELDRHPGTTVAGQAKQIYENEFSSIAKKIQAGLPHETKSRAVRKPGSHFEPRTEQSVQQDYAGSGASRDSPASSPAAGAQSQAPVPARLRAKYRKLCKVCGSLLADPDRRPGQAKYITKSIARPVLPGIEIHEVEGNQKMLFRNFGSSAMHVKLASLDARVSVPAHIRIPPSTAEGFMAPLFLVARESVESKQAFMSGAKTHTEGPGWSVEDLELAEGSAIALPESLVVFASTSMEGSEHDPVGAWMKLTLPKLG